MPYEVLAGKTFVHRVLRFLSLRFAIRRERLALAELPPERLRDLGLSPAERLCECRRPFWQVGPARRSFEKALSSSLADLPCGTVRLRPNRARPAGTRIARGCWTGRPAQNNNPI